MEKSTMRFNQCVFRSYASFAVLRSMFSKRYFGNLVLIQFMCGMITDHQGHAGFHTFGCRNSVKEDSSRYCDTVHDPWSDRPKLDRSILWSDRSTVLV